jgi:hypothetical protein
MNGRMSGVILAILVVALGAWLFLGGSRSQDTGQPSPHAINQSN